MSDARVANRYARSLVTISREDDTLDQVHQDALKFLEITQQNRDVTLAFSNPVISQEKKLNLARKIFQNLVSARTLKFIELVIKHQRGSLLVPIFKRIVHQYKTIKGIVDAKVQAPVELDDAIQDQLKKLVQQTIGEAANTVNLETHKNPDMLGGFKLQFEDKLLDKSVDTQLKNIRQALKQ